MLDKVVAASPPTKGRARQGRRETPPFGEYGSIHADPSFDRRIPEVTAKGREDRKKIDKLREPFLSIADACDVTIQKFLILFFFKGAPHGKQQQKIGRVEEGGVFPFSVRRKTECNGRDSFVCCM